MKKYFAFIVFAGLLSCKKILDVQSFTAITDATAFETADRALLALNGVYDAAQSGGYNGGTEKRGYPFGSANIQQGDNRGEDVVNLAAFYQITYQATYNPNTANNNNMWDASYALINKANIVIEGVKDAAGRGTLSTAIATQYEAECRFLRAMAHHELVINFARPYLDGNGNALGVPYRDVAITSGSAVEQVRSLPRPKVAEDYQKILADLDFAESNLPATQTGATGISTYRATKAAAIALKMRVKLHMGDYAGVITEGNKLVPQTPPYVSPIGGWTLTASPAGPFSAPGGLNASVENIFSVKNDPLDATSVNGSLPGQYGPANLGGRGLVGISPVIWNNPAWLCNDTRRSLLYTSGTNVNAATSILTTKYKDYATRGDYAPQIRYAEVLLTLAEAEARQAAGVSVRALALLNAVRNRALANPATEGYTIASFLTKEDLVKAILFERRVEFLAEGRRWGDIHRLSGENNPNYTPGGIPAKAINGAQGAAIYGCGQAYTPTQPAIPYSDYRFIWPIPADEIAQNPVISQNPGY